MRHDLGHYFGGKLGILMAVKRKLSRVELKRLLFSQRGGLQHCTVD